MTQEKLMHEHSIRVFVTQKSSGYFGFEIFTLNKPELRAGIPWVRHSFFTQSFNKYSLALKAGVEEGITMITKHGEKPSEWID